MTVVVAWKRTFKQGVQELCFASDSRLRDGRVIDCAQKIFPLKRGDITIAFAGETAIAYPYILQVINSLDSFYASKTRGLDVIEERAHVIKMLNQLVDNMNVPEEYGEKIPDVEIILGGYSWIRKKFCLWYIHYNKKLKKFHYDSAKSFGGERNCIVFAGDKKDVLKKKFEKKIYAEQGSKKKKFILNLEPLQCLTELLLERDDSSTIGFPPQFAKVYQHLNAFQIPLLYENNVYYCGRKLLGYEHYDRWPLSLETFENVDPKSLNQKK